METIHFHYNEKIKEYGFGVASSVEIEILKLFLESDVLGSPSMFIEWANQDVHPYTNGNLSILEKRGDLIIINNILSDEEDGGPFLEISKNDFIKILRAWDRIQKEKPKEVMIIKEGDTYRVETKN